MSKDNTIRLESEADNGEMVSGEVVNMDNMTHITITENDYRIYFINGTSPLCVQRDTTQGRALAHWITWLVAPVTESPGSTTYRIRPE